MRITRIPTFLRPEIIPFVDVQIVPVSPDLTPIVEVTLVPVTHYIPPFTHRLKNGDQLALCDAYVLTSQFSTEPTCTGCRAQLFDDDAAIDALRKAAW